MKLSCMNCDGSCVIIKQLDTYIIKKDEVGLKCPYCNEPIVWDERDSMSFICIHCDGLCKIVKLEDGSYKVTKEEEDEDDSKWDLLVHQIINGEIIPVIGEDIVLNGNRSVRQILINSMCRTDGIILDEPSDMNPHDKTLRQHSYSELIYHPHYAKDKELIYARINKLIEKYENQFKPSDLLKRVLSIKQFPFVITVSSDFVTENAMRRIWEERGRNIKTLVFNNDPSEIDKKEISRESLISRIQLSIYVW